MPAEGRENPLLKKGNFDAFFREKYLTKNTKDQVSTGTLITPVLLVLMFIPMFGELVDVLAEISKYLFTGVIMEMILNLAAGEKPFETVSIIAMVVEFAAAILLFTVFYRRNGYEKD